jgi:gas vesicle protein
MPTKALSSKKSFLTAGLAAGAAIGVVAAYYLNTPKGRKMLKDAEKKAVALQKKLIKELEDTKELTRTRYEEIVEKLLKIYSKSKDISENELPEIRKYLLSKWKHIEKEFKDSAK